MQDQPELSAFRGLRLKLSLPVVVGSLVLLLYYLKLLQLDSNQARKTIYFAAFLMPLSLLWPIPFNRRLISPLVRYLQGNGSAVEAEKSAAEFPFRSSFISLGSWIFCGILFVIFSHVVLFSVPIHSLYIFIGFVSGGIAASFVHFLLLREAMEKLRIRIAQEIVRPPVPVRLSILMKLLLAFTMLISLSLLFFALISQSHLDEQTRLLQGKFSQEELATWSNALNHDPTVQKYLPNNLTVSKTSQPNANQVRLQNGKYLVKQQQKSEDIQFPFRWDDTLFMLCTVLIGGLIAYFAANDISRHLNEIRAGTRWIAQGDFNHRLNIVSDDEVAELAGSINQIGRASCRERV